MTTEAQRLGDTVSAALTSGLDAVEVDMADLKAAGLPIRSREYADWLHTHKLRMWRAGPKRMRFTRAPELPADLNAAIANPTKEVAALWSHALYAAAGLIRRQ